jgi:hypothetical protein
MTPAEPDRQPVRQEMEQARQAFYHLLDHATVADVRRPSDGTSWTNEHYVESGIASSSPDIASDYSVPLSVHADWAFAEQGDVGGVPS